MERDVPAGTVLGRQVDGVTCGPSVLVVTAVLTGSGRPGPAAARFAAAQRLAHRQANRLWPRMLGTTPWGMRAWLRRHAPAAGGYRIRPASRAVLRGLRTDRPIPLLVGSRWLPRHWVLVTGTDDDGARLVYEPSSGQVRALGVRAFVDGTAVRELGWPRPWCVLLPSSPGSGTRTRGDRRRTDHGSGGEAVGGGRFHSESVISSGPTRGRVPRRVPVVFIRLRWAAPIAPRRGPVAGRVPWRVP